MLFHTDPDHALAKGYRNVFTDFPVTHIPPVSFRKDSGRTINEAIAGPFQSFETIGYLRKEDGRAIFRYLSVVYYPAVQTPKVVKLHMSAVGPQGPSETGQIELAIGDQTIMTFNNHGRQLTEKGPLIYSAEKIRWNGDHPTPMIKILKMHADKCRLTWASDSPYVAWEDTEYVEQ